MIQWGGQAVGKTIVLLFYTKTFAIQITTIYVFEKGQ